MKISLFDKDDLTSIKPEDLKPFEDMLVRVFLRTLRLAAKEHLVEGMAEGLRAAVAPVALSLVAAPPAGAAAEPAAAAAPAAAAQPPAAPPPEDAADRRRKKSRSLRDVLKVVPWPEKPAGYITMDDARKLVGNDSATQAAISRWLLDEQIHALIVRGGSLKPSKGLPGRVFINKQQLVDRDKQRQHNLKTLPALARWNTGKQRHDRPAA